jgi:cytoskeletal protein CcmA (bactofilin family)
MLANDSPMMVDFAAEKITTVVGKGSINSGDVHTKEGVLVLGAIHGHVTAEAGTIFIGEGGLVLGNVSGGRVVVSGEVTGDVLSTDNLLLSNTGLVRGNVRYKNFSMMPEAVIEGVLSKIKDGQ